MKHRMTLQFPALLAAGLDVLRLGAAGHTAGAPRQAKDFLLLGHSNRVGLGKVANGERAR